MEVVKVEKQPNGSISIDLTLDETRLRIDVHPDNSIHLFSPSNLKVGEKQASNALDIFVERRRF